MLPFFTAEAAAGGRRTYRVSTRSADRDVPGKLTTQQRGRGGEWGPDQGPLEFSSPCPGCFTHQCGFLGLHTCLTCC